MSEEFVSRFVAAKSEPARGDPFQTTPAHGNFVSASVPREQRSFHGCECAKDDSAPWHARNLAVFGDGGRNGDLPEYKMRVAPRLSHWLVNPILFAQTIGGGDRLDSDLPLSHKKCVPADALDSPHVRLDFGLQRHAADNC